MKLVKLKDLFNIKRGVNLVFSNCNLDNNGIPFVSRTEKNNDICGYVKLIDNIIPNPAKTISVASSGSVGSFFLQKNHIIVAMIFIFYNQKKKRQNMKYCIFMFLLKPINIVILMEDK